MKHTHITTTEETSLLTRIIVHITKLPVPKTPETLQNVTREFENRLIAKKLAMVILNML